MTPTAYGPSVVLKCLTYSDYTAKREEDHIALTVTRASQHGHRYATCSSVKRGTNRNTGMSNLGANKYRGRVRLTHMRSLREVNGELRSY